MMQQPLISIVLPVYNRSQYLDTAIQSVLEQSYQNWELIIADDKSDEPTKALLRKYQNHEQIKLHFNDQNLGLFANLNQAIFFCQGKYITILCSDDYFLPNCLEVNLTLIQKYNQVGLLLSSFKFVDDQGYFLPTPPYPECAKNTRIWMSDESVPLLLKYGSINGNITGMFFKPETIYKVGGFREDWRHAGDWEWLYRVCRDFPILMSREDVVVIRNHEQQLSGVNFYNLSNSLEVIEMTKTLLNDSFLQPQRTEAKKLAALNLQYHFWFALKFFKQGRFQDAFKIMRAIHKVIALPNVFMAMLRFLPSRWVLYNQSLKQGRHHQAITSKQI